MSSKKLPVAINVFPTLDYIELVQFDDKTGEIEKASALPCMFDSASRQMMDRDQMTQTIRDLYNMNRIPVTTPAVLVLPSFFTREIELPAEFTRDELRFALVSEAERFYIFKKVEPHIDWINLDESRLLYSAFPKTEIEKYTQIFQELRIPLMAIELSYFSILRGLISTGAVADELAAQGRWCLLVVSDSSFFASLQEGVKILKTTDAPLSVTVEDESAIVHEIRQDFDEFATHEAFTKLVVVNNASRISSDTLLSQLSFQGNLVLVEQNGLTLRSRGATDGAFPCSLEAVGGVFYSELPELAQMNFLPESGEDVVGILHYRKRAFIWLMVANAAVFLVCLMLWGVMALLIWQKDHERDELIRQSAALGATISSQQVQEIGSKKFIKQIVDRNVAVNNFLVQLGMALPAETWLEKISLAADGDVLQVVVDGRALSLEQVNRLQSTLTQAIPGIALEVSNAAQEANSDGQSYFVWTIQNKQAPPGDAAAGGGGSSAPAPGGGMLHGLDGLGGRR